MALTPGVGHITWEKGAAGGQALAAAAARAELYVAGLPGVPRGVKLT